MAVQAPPRLIPVRCPVSGHLLFRAERAEFGQVLGTLCKCKRWVFGTDARRLAVRDEQPPLD
ncbi:MAG TPA: hypothetical protein VN524_18980 [Hyphomicrobiaceae bacterium]|nr:hypothetical protein [Hyphomicrobiaceae bacterium]